MCRTEKETQMYRTVFWTLGEGEGGITEFLSRVEVFLLTFKPDSVFELDNG